MSLVAHTFECEMVVMGCLFALQLIDAEPGVVRLVLARRYKVPNVGTPTTSWCDGSPNATVRSIMASCASV